jgi:hypothetical protein
VELTVCLHAKFALDQKGTISADLNSDTPFASHRESSSHLPIAFTHIGGITFKAAVAHTRHVADNMDLRIRVGNWLACSILNCEN